MKKEKALKTNKEGFSNKLLNQVEKYGNKLPDILTLFLILSGIVLLASFVAGSLGLSVVNPADDEKISAVNLLTSDGIIKMLTSLVSNFMEFPPLGVVLVAMLGVGLAESTGLLATVIKVTVLKSPRFLVLPIIILMGIVGNAAGDAAFIVLPPIAAVVFISLGIHPLAGIAVAYASVAAGYGANLLINISDVLLAGFTQTGVSMVDENLIINASINYYFAIASTFLLIPVAIFVTRKIIIPRLGEYEGLSSEIVDEITSEEKRGLKWAGGVLSILVIILLYLTIPENALLRDAETGSLIQSPLMDSLIPIIFILSFLPALAYGVASNDIKSDKDVTEHLTKVMEGMAYYILISFVAAQMIAYFQWSNLGPITAIKGADFLSELGITGLPLIIGFIIFVGFLNILIASTTAKWAMLAPVFVPMFMYLDINPAVTQASYRIADSITNPITPMLAYFAILLMAAQKYDKNIKLGTLVSLLIPYSIAFAITWIIFFAVWYLLGLPFGPGF